MRRRLLLAPLFFCAAMAMAQPGQQSTQSPAKSAEATLPTVDQLLEKYVQAIGGRANIEKLTTRVIKGSLVTSAGSAPLEIYQKTPNKFLVIIDSPAGGLSRNAYNGTIAWSQNRQRGLREMSGPEVENFKREYDIHREIRLKEHFPKMTVKGREKVGEREAYLITAETKEGVAEVIYFDVESGLLTRRDVTVQGTTLETRFEDYRVVDGVKLPFTVRRSRADFSFTHKYDDVKHNTTIDDAKFDKPATP